MSLSQNDLLKKYPEVSVVILNFNGEKFLRECLNSLKEVDYPKDKYKVIVVDNGSVDSSVEIIKKEFPEVLIIKNSKNFGFAKGNNIGIRQCKSEYIILLNMDTKVDRNWLKELVRVMELYKEAGCCGAREQPYDKAIFTNNDIFEGNWMGAGSTIYRKIALDEVGLFDEMYFAYCEDMDLSWRLKLKGWKIICNPKAVWYHFGMNRKTLIGDKRLFLSLRNRILLIAKFGSLKQIFKSLNIYFKKKLKKEEEISVNKEESCPKGRGISSLGGSASGGQGDFLIKVTNFYRKAFLVFCIFWSVLFRIPLIIQRRTELRRKFGFISSVVDKWIQSTDIQLFGK